MAAASRALNIGVEIAQLLFVGAVLLARATVPPMRTPALVSIVALALCAHSSPHALAQAAPPVANGKVPPNANTTDPTAPFYIDLTGLDLSTVPPTRNPLSPNYPPATELPDGQVPPINGYGNFIIGPTHLAAPETVPRRGVPKGRILTFTMTSTDSVMYRPGLVRQEATFDGGIFTAKTVEGDPSKLVISTSIPGTWTRPVSVYVPWQHVRGTRAPFLLIGDGGGPLDQTIFTVLDNLIAERRIPAMVAIALGNGGQDAQGAQRGLDEVGDQDLFYPIVSMADGMHDWVLANQNMARALAAMGYKYQFVFSRNAGHGDSATFEQTLPAALEWLWQGYHERHFPPWTQDERDPR